MSKEYSNTPTGKEAENLLKKVGRGERSVSEKMTDYDTQNHIRILGSVILDLKWGLDLFAQGLMPPGY
ncbi:MAG: hypothetical protein JXB10_11245 [Pirellulales bacterium]|nr:hypothetical protein [Pirellulales bacterium]